MPMIRRIAPLLIAALALTGCAATTPTVEPTPERVTVQWDDYAPGLQERIDTADCDTLDEEFQAAVANNDAVANRTDHNNAELMRYIDEAGELAGC